MSSNVFKIFLFCYLVLFAGGSLFSEEVEGEKDNSKKIIIDEVVIKYIDISEEDIYFDNDELFEYIFNSPSSFFTDNYLDETKLSSDIENIKQLYVNYGYFNSVIKLDTLDKFFKDDKQLCNISFSIKQDSVIKVGDVKLTNNNFFNDSIIGDVQEKSLIKLVENNRFLKSKLDETSNNLLKFYAENGFLDTEINSNLVLDSIENRVDIEFDINEGLRYKIGDIKLENERIKTKPFVISREFEFKKDEIVTYSKLIRTQRYLYELDIFSSVFVKPRPLRRKDKVIESENKTSYIKNRDILIELKEKKKIKFRTKIGYGTIDRVRSSFGLTHRNLFNTARKLNLELKWSNINRLGSIIISQPWTFGYKFSTGLEMKYEYEKNPGFNNEEYYSAIIFGIKTYQNQLNTILSPFYKKVHPFDITLNPENLSDGIIIESYELIGTKLQFSFDKRDDIFNTKEGYFLSSSNEIAGSFFGGNVNYNLIEFTGKYFWNINIFSKRKNIDKYQTVFASSLNFSSVNAIKNSDIPISELFYSGGPNELRGFDFQKVSPVDSEGTAIGGKIKIVTTLIEVRQNIYNSLDFVSFCDVGNVWKIFSAVNLSDIKINVGIGFRIDTPIFLLRLDYGKNVTPDDKSDNGVFQFGIGQVF